MSELVEFCKKRMTNLKEQMDKYELDLVYLINNSRGGLLFKRIAETSSGNSIIIPREGDSLLFVYSVDYISTNEESWLNVKQIKDREKARKQICEYANNFLEADSKVGVQVNSLTKDDYEFFNKILKGELVNINDSLIPEVFYGLFPEEIKYQRKVSKIADYACIAVREAMEERISEYELAAVAEYEMRRRGAEVTSFNTIISTGPRSAYSHGYPTERKLKKNELLLVDLGPQIKGYAADETRTYLFGKNSKKEKMLNAVNESVEKVIQNIQPGVPCKELDAISRKVLKNKGFPDYPHSLGHPISGFLVPNISKNSEHILKPGMLFTVEPGIYLPEYGGVRMEENIVVTEDGFEQLTESPRMLEF